MQPRTSGMWRLVLTGMLVAGAAACQKETTTPPASPVVTVTPANSSINVGETVQLVASVSNTTDQTVTWASASPSVATVDANGLVTGVAAGTATITATTPGGYKGAAAVVVSGSSSAGNPQVTIASVTMGNTTTPVDQTNVSGMIAVTANIDAQPGQVTGYTLMVGDSVVSQQSVSVGGSVGDKPAAAQGVSQVTASVNTAKFNGSSGAVAWQNGPVTLKAEITGSTGSVVATATMTLVFNNANTTAVMLSTPDSAISPSSGLLWNGGTLTATAVPVIYSGSTTISQVTFTNNFGAGSKTVTASPFTTTYAADTATGSGGSMDVEQSVTVSAATVTATGSNGPSGSSAAMRLDNKAPTAGALTLTDQGLDGNDAIVPCCANNWINASYMFSDGKGTDTDGGVGGISVTYHVGSPDSTDAYIATLPADSSGASLDTSSVNTKYKVVAVVMDALGNTSMVHLTSNGSFDPFTTFGVDKVAPTLTLSGDANHAVNPGGSFTVTGSDDVSGFHSPFVAATLVENFGDTCVIGYGNSCTPDLVTSTTADQGGSTDEAYYTFTAYVLDQAGNASADSTRTILVDVTSPQVGNVALPATLKGGTAETFTTSATDNVDMATADFRLDYTNGVAYPFAAPAAIGDGTGFDSNRATSANLTASPIFVRSVESAAAMGTLYPASDALFNVTDYAGNASSQSNNFAGGTVPAGVSASTLGVTGFTVTEADSASCSTAPCSSTVTVKAAATGASGTFANPFSMVHFYWVDGSAAIHYAVGTGAASVSDDGTTRTWTWTATFNGKGLDLSGGVFSMGVSSAGDGLYTGTLAVTARP